MYMYHCSCGGPICQPLGNDNHGRRVPHVDSIHSPPGHGFSLKKKHHQICISLSENHFNITISSTYICCIDIVSKSTPKYAIYLPLRIYPKGSAKSLVCRELKRCTCLSSVTSPKSASMASRKISAWVVPETNSN